MGIAWERCKGTSCRERDVPYLTGVWGTPGYALVKSHPAVYLRHILLNVLHVNYTSIRN